MGRLNDVLHKSSLDGILSYLVRNEDEDQAAAGREEQELEDSYDAFVEKLEELYPGADGQKEELLQAVSAFAEVHDRAYFRTGVLTGFRLHRELEEEYGRQSRDRIPDAMKRYGLSAGVSKCKEETVSLLEQYFATRIDTALEEELRRNERYQDARDKSRRSAHSIHAIGLDREQWEAVDQVLSAGNRLGAEYGRVAYTLGFQDAMDIVVEIQGVRPSAYAAGI